MLYAFFAQSTILASYQYGYQSIKKFKKNSLFDFFYRNNMKNINRKIMII